MADARDLDEDELRRCCGAFLRYCERAGLRVRQGPRQVEAMLYNLRTYGRVRWDASPMSCRDLEDVSGQWCAWLTAWTEARHDALESRGRADATE